MVTYTLTPSTAKWRLDDGSWNASGATVTSTVGNHTITFQSVTGYTTPASKTITLSAGETYTETVDYAVIQPTVQYTLTPSTAKWKLDNGSWNASGATVTSTVGSHTITFQSVTGYTTPASKTITLVAAQNYTEAVDYAVIPPTVEYTLTPSTVKWKLDNGSWNNSGATVTTTVGNHTITFQSVTGYTTPASKTITLVAAQNYTETVNYAVIQPTVQCTLTPSTAKWKLDNGSWNNSGATVTTTVGNHTITFSDVTGYTTSSSKTITLVAAQNYTETVDYAVIPPTVQYTLTPSSAKWKLDNGSWNNSGAKVTTTVGSHTISFSEVEEYKTPANQTITLTAGQELAKNVRYFQDIACHPADFENEDGEDGGDGFIDGYEYQKYAAPVKKAALGGYEYTWDGVDVMSMTKKAPSRGISTEDATRSGISIERIVEPPVYSAGSTLTVTLRITGANQLMSVSLVERIPEGWSVVGATDANFVSSTRKYTIIDDSGNIKSEYSYQITAPQENLDDEYEISSFNSTCYTPLDGDTIRFSAGTTTIAKSLYHPADFEDEDGNEGGDGYIDGFEYQKYAAPVKKAALGGYEYTWDGVDVMSMMPMAATRGGRTRSGTRGEITIERIITPSATYTAGALLTVTLRITGADELMMVTLAERIPQGWTVVGATDANFVQSTRKYTIIDDSGDIKDEYSYQIIAPLEDLADEYEISSIASSCYTPFDGETVRFSAGTTKLNKGVEIHDYDEWPEDVGLYAPFYGKIFREGHDSAILFSWPAILQTEYYRLVVRRYNGEVAFDEFVNSTSCMVEGLECGFYLWNVTAVGNGCIAGTSEDLCFAVIANDGMPIITNAVADGTTIELQFDTSDEAYEDGFVTYHVKFYSFETFRWTELTQMVQILGGKARIELGVNTKNGYLNIENGADSIELYIK